MILSFHPLFEGDRLRRCAGRLPDATDRAAIRAAAGVALPQGCGKALYRMARQNCPQVFPNYDARFAYPGKIGQIRLFRKTGAAHPATEVFADVAAFRRRFAIDSRLRPPERFDLPARPGAASGSIAYPLVFKFTWGGEGETVFRAPRPQALAELLDRAALYEKTGQRGFLIQEFIPPGNRSLRVVVIGRIIRSYWRALDGGFGSSLSAGARIPEDVDPEQSARAEAATADFCRRAGIDLAGLDFLFHPESGLPLFLEINYFFGRRGLGGSQAYYDLLLPEMAHWAEMARGCPNRGSS